MDGIWSGLWGVGAGAAGVGAVAGVGADAAGLGFAGGWIEGGAEDDCAVA